jgi:hypothetical protein
MSKSPMTTRTSETSLIRSRIIEIAKKYDGIRIFATTASDHASASTKNFAYFAHRFCNNADRSERVRMGKNFAQMTAQNPHEAPESIKIERISTK